MFNGKQRTEARKLMLRKGLVLLMAVALLASTGLMPAGQSHAIGQVNSAKLPKAYASGYHVYKCIDISNWQGALTKAQFKSLKNKYGITHVIVRVGYTRWASFLRFKDASYKENINNAYAAGLKVGAYYYSQAKTQKEAKKEAQKTIKLLKNYKKKITLPVAFDWEWGGRLNARWAKGNGKTANTRICQAYCDTIKAAGYTPMVYASSSVFINYLDRDTLHKKYRIWMAHYTAGKATDYAKPLYMWQFSSTARFGANLTGTTNVDLNYLFIKKNGKWVRFSDGRYKYKEDKQYLKNQWLTKDGKKYYLDKNGYRLTDCYQKIGNYWYGFDAKGVMYKNRTAVIKGNTYKFTSNGRAVLYRVKVVNVTDGLAYRTGPSTSSSYRTEGNYDTGYKFDVVRESSGKGWVQAGSGAGKGCWSKKEGKKYPYVEIIKEYPL